MTVDQLELCILSILFVTFKTRWMYHTWKLIPYQKFWSINGLQNLCENRNTLDNSYFLLYDFSEFGLHIKTSFMRKAGKGVFRSTRKQWGDIIGYFRGTIIRGDISKHTKFVQKYCCIYLTNLVPNRGSSCLVSGIPWYKKQYPQHFCTFHETCIACNSWGSFVFHTNLDMALNWYYLKKHLYWSL